MSDAKEETRQVEVLPVKELGSVIVQDDGTVVILVEHEGGEFGLLLQPEKAEELTGALIERPHGSYREAFGSPDEQSFDVVADEVTQVEPDAYVLRLESDKGVTLTFRLGTRRLIRIRNTMTAQIARRLTRKPQ